jgi:hypothetical protein
MLGIDAEKLGRGPGARRNQIKNLINMGKERGFLTYAEINDQLPENIVDPEAIEGIIATFNDMGIAIYERAPDADSLLLTDSVPPSPQRRRSGSGCRDRAVDRRFRLWPHHRPGPHVHA